MAVEKWFCGGRRCQSSDLAHILDEKRAEKRKRSVALHRAVAARRQDEKDHRALKAALRRLVRLQERENRVSIRAIVKPRRNGGGGSGRDRAFERMLSLAIPRLRASGGGLSSFHLRFRSRGLGARRRNRSHIFRRGETVKSLLYILREDAREIAGGGIISNLGDDTQELAGCFGALEELERQDRTNANVYSMLVVSLPHELQSGERLDVLREICGILGEHDLGHVGVLHAPDPEGDDRNFHAHILLSWRPIERIGPNVFSFSAEKHSDLNDASFILPFRHRVEAILNQAMEKAGHTRRFTALSDAARGLLPRTKASGKSTPGLKAVERRQRKVDDMIARRDMLARIRDAVTAIRAVSEKVMASPTRDWMAEAAGAIAKSTRVMTPVLEPIPTAVPTNIVTPSPSDIGSAVTARPIMRPDETARRAFIGRLLTGLEGYAYLPLRERRGVGVAPGGPVLDLHVRDPDRSDAGFLRDVDRMSDEPEIQSALRLAYERMLNQARGELTQGRMKRPDTGLQDIGMEMESRHPAFRDAVAVARGDAAFEAMLADVRAFWDRRDKEARDHRREQARAERQRAIASITITEIGRQPELERAFQRFAVDLIAGRVVLTRDTEGPSMKLAKGVKRDDATLLAAHAAGRRVLNYLADLLAPKAGTPTVQTPAVAPTSSPTVGSDERQAMKPWGGPSR